MAEELQKDRRQMQRRTERPPGPALLSFVSTAMKIFARGILVIENSFPQILQKARQMMQINCDLDFFGIFCIG